MNYNPENSNYQDESRAHQKHVHELTGSVKFSDQEDPHGHRFCTVTGEEIPFGFNNHIHEVAFRTDYHDDHYHEFRGRTGYSIPVGNKHIHYIESVTSIDDGHWHAFEAATLTNNPAGSGHRHMAMDQQEDYYDYNDDYPENEYNIT